MSTTLAGPSVSNPARDWLLPLPQDIVTDESFTNDLLRQFDKRRNRLRFEMQGFEDREKSSSPSLEEEAASVEKTPQQEAPPPPPPPPPPASEERQLDSSDDKAARRRSAGDLLRRSSAYLRSKIEALKGTSRSHDNLRDYHSDRGPRTAADKRSSIVQNSWSSHRKPSPLANNNDASSSSSLPPPSKLVVNTTIAIPQYTDKQHRVLSAAAAAIQPPIITQYPPKPLKYSPVEPTSDDSTGSSATRRWNGVHHRISLPALRPSKTVDRPRRRSDVGVQRPRAAPRKKGKERVAA